MSERRNPYHVLGLKKGATEIQIKEAYKVLARKHHPDRNPNDPGARDRFIEIKEAYEDLIERKTSSPVISQVEETNAEFRRGGGYRRLVFRVGGVAGVVLIAGAAFLFSGEIEFRFRDAMARSGDAKTAEKWLGPIAARTGPHAAEARLDVARRYLTENDTASAARILSAADDALSLAILGDVHARAGKRDDARKAYERAIGRAKSGETSARAYAGFLASRDDAAAARVLADAIARYPKDPWVGWMTAVRDLRATKLESARHVLEGNNLPAAKVVLAAALVSEARHLGGDLRRLADRQALVKEAQSLLEDASPDPASSWPFGWLLPPVELLRRRPDDWRPTTSLDRIDVARDLARSAASRALGKDGHDESVEYARRARDADPASEAAMMQLGAAHLARASQGDDDGLKARSAFTSARTADARSAQAAAGLALALASLKNDSENEMAAWKSAIAIEPENAEWHFGFARSLARGGPERIADRMGADRRAIKLAPDFGAPRLDLADALFERDELGEAVKALQAATAVPESASRAWRELGDYYFFAKKFPEAVSAYRKAATDPDATAQSAAWLGAAKALGRLKKTVEAHEAIDRATSLDDNLKLNPDDPDLALALKGYSAKMVSRGEDAAIRLQKLGEAHYARANYSEALAAFSQASVIGGQTTRALAWHGMARCYATQGLLHDAVLAMDRALKISPELPLNNADPGVRKLLDVAHYEAPGKGTR